MIGKLLERLHRPIYRKRLSVLVRLISPYLRNGDWILDVGCGSGALGAALISSNKDLGLKVTGVEKSRRRDEAIEVVTYNGKQLPCSDRSQDVVILADVLHHEEDFEKLLYESIRVSRRLLIIKDHQIAGPLAQSRISLADWAANIPYGVKCIYRYNRPDQWDHWIDNLGLRALLKLHAIDLYPPIVNFLFGRRLQFFLVAQIEEAISSVS